MTWESKVPTCRRSTPGGTSWTWQWCSVPVKLTNQVSVLRSCDQNIYKWQTSMKVLWSVLTNQRPVLWSHDQYCPIIAQNSGHLMYKDQAEASIQVTWPVLTNQRLVFRSSDQYWPIRGQYSPGWACDSQHRGCPGGRGSESRSRGSPRVHKTVPL